MEETVGYPITSKNYPILSYLDCIDLPPITAAYVSDTYYEFNSHTFIWAKNNPTALNCYTNINELINNIVTLVVLPLQGVENEEVVLETILTFINHIHELYILEKFAPDNLMKIEECCIKNSVIFHNMAASEKSNLVSGQIKNNNNIGNSIFPIATPIVTIAGLSEFCGTIELQLGIRKKFSQSDYRVCHISDLEYAEALGFYSMPSFVSDNLCSDIEKAVLFNRYIKFIEVCEHPDVIIISIPNALLPYNNEYTAGFGILPFILFQAFSSDFNIVSINYNEYQQEDIDEIQRCLKYRFNFLPDSIIVSDIFADVYNPNDERKVKYYNIASENVQKLCDSHLKLYNIRSNNVFDRIYQQIIEDLNANALNDEV